MGLKSISATELSKLGKCEIIITKSTSDTFKNKGKWKCNVKNVKQGKSPDIARGELAHLRYESMAKKFMNGYSVNIRRSLFFAHGLIVLFCFCVTFLAWNIK